MASGSSRNIGFSHQRTFSSSGYRLCASRRRDFSGSGRSINGLHLRDALERLDTLNPGLILKFGGHAMAAGLTLEEQKFTQFQENFSNLMAELLDNDMLEGVIWSDGELNNEELSLDIAELIRNGGPWGQAFPEPIFDGKFRLLQQRLVGDCHLK